ncbi:MAG: hypothetical protein C0596_00505 [Marinilabiliales bacterium]|nr:MAG: hypothetical protein C0596_00505 [Marinilabiliales bacterium]
MAQTSEFAKLIDKTKQSYLDRGYELIAQKSDSIVSGVPLVSPEINLDYKTYYIVLVQLDGCFYCEYDIQFVDDKDYLFELDYEFLVEDGLKQGVYKFNNEQNTTGKYVVFLDSDLPYYANIFIFKK